MSEIATIIDEINVLLFFDSLSSPPQSAGAKRSAEEAGDGDDEAKDRGIKRIRTGQNSSAPSRATSADTNVVRPRRGRPVRRSRAVIFAPSSRDVSRARSNSETRDEQQATSDDANAREQVDLTARDPSELTGGNSQDGSNFLQVPPRNR